jgi:hypothetical protein
MIGERLDITDGMRPGSQGIMRRNRFNQRLPLLVHEAVDLVHKQLHCRHRRPITPTHGDFPQLGYSSWLTSCRQGILGCGGPLSGIWYVISTHTLWRDPHIARIPHKDVKSSLQLNRK